MGNESEKERVRVSAEEVAQEYADRMKAKSEKNAARCKRYRAEYPGSVKAATKKRKHKMKEYNRRYYLAHREELLKKAKERNEK